MYQEQNNGITLTYYLELPPFDIESFLLHGIKPIFTFKMFFGYNLNQLIPSLKEMDDNQLNSNSLSCCFWE